MWNKKKRSSLLLLHQLWYLKTLKTTSVKYSFKLYFITVNIKSAFIVVIAALSLECKALKTSQINLQCQAAILQLWLKKSPENLMYDILCSSLNKQRSVSLVGQTLLAIIIKSLTFKNSANLLHQDCVGVVWSDLIDSGNISINTRNSCHVFSEILINPHWCSEICPKHLKPLRAQTKAEISHGK